MVDHGTEVGQALRTAIAGRVGEARFGLWFGDGVRLGLEGDSLTVGVPNRYFLDRIRRHYADAIQRAGEEVAGHQLQVRYELDDSEQDHRGVSVQFEKDSTPRQAESRSSDRSVRRVEEAELERPRTPSASRRRRPSKRLDQFIPGPCNRLALAAAAEVSESLGESFNPLVIHGAIGLGKTHLLEGIGEQVRRRHPGLQVVQQTAEGFTNGFLESMRNGGLNSFRARYRSAELLLIDDVHFIASKRATMDEFQHTFDALINMGAPVVLVSDRHPRLISKLTDELVTRMLGGMVVKLEAPDPITRKAILRAKAAERGVDLPEPVAGFIAEHLRASVRELEGALQSVLSLAALTGKKLDLNLARTALRELIRHTAQAVVLKDIEQAICQLFEVTPDDLKSESRARAITHPRMLAMYLARRHTTASYSEIGRYFGGRNHSTVISADKKVRRWLREEQRQHLLSGFETVAEVLAAAESSLGA